MNGEALDPVGWLYGLQAFGVKLGLDNIRALLDVLGRPDRAFRSILVAGTNGKGSVAAMLQSMLDAHGVRTGMFTSPHLVRPNERVRVDGEDISDDALQTGLTFLRSTIEQGLADGRLEVHPSFFEVVTALAIHAFHERRMDAAVLEVGLGGRLDATNAVDADVSVVVSIGLDHTVTLGPTLTAIAGEKGGVIKGGRPVVSGVVQQAAINVLRSIARERNATWVEARQSVRFESETATDGAFTLAGRRRYEDLRLPLAGRHQIENARVAVAALETFADACGITPDPAAVRDGLARTRWPGRLQWIRSDTGPDMLLDGAHNRAGAHALARYLRDLPVAPWVLLGAMRGKDLEGLVEPIAPWIRGATVTLPGVKRSAAVEEVAEAAGRHVAHVETVDAPADALARARAAAGRDGVVLVTGSLYLVGEVLGLLETNPVPGPLPM